MKVGLSTTAKNPPEIIERLADACKQLEIASWTELAYRLEMSTATISNLAQRNWRPSIGLMLKFADLLKAPITDVLIWCEWIDPPETSTTLLEELAKAAELLDDQGLASLIEQAGFQLWRMTRERYTSGAETEEYVS